MENGFFELGRFARAYREMFGEAPSATLRGAISTRPRQDAAGLAENRNVCRYWPERTNADAVGPSVCPDADVG